MHNYLLIVSIKEDAAKLDNSTEEEPHFKKLGDKVFLTSFVETPEKVYPALQKEFGIKGRISWIELPSAIVTPGWKVPM